MLILQLLQFSEGFRSMNTTKIYEQLELCVIFSRVLILFHFCDNNIN